MKNIQIILAGAVLFIVACICGSTPTTSPEQTSPTARPGETAAPTFTPKPAPLGATRDQPYPVDTVVDVGGDTQISIISVTRPADEIVVAGNMFNNTPEPNLEYVIVKLHVQCNKPTNEKCDFSTYELKTVGANGRVQDQVFVAGVPEELEAFSEMFGGASIEGSLVFLATKDDSKVVLFYEPLIFGDPVYIALQ